MSIKNSIVLGENYVNFYKNLKKIEKKIGFMITCTFFIF